MATLRLAVTFENGDTGETFEEDFTVESDDQVTTFAASQIEAAEDALAALEVLHPILEEGAKPYTEFLGLFSWRGHDKLDWNDVMISLRSIAAGQVCHQLDEDILYEEDLMDQAKIQLVRSEEGPSMYFVDGF